MTTIERMCAHGTVDVKYSLAHSHNHCRLLTLNMSRLVSSIAMVCAQLDTRSVMTKASHTMQLTFTDIYWCERLVSHVKVDERSVNWDSCIISFVDRQSRQSVTQLIITQVRILLRESIQTELVQIPTTRCRHTWAQSCLCNHHALHKYVG